MCWKTRTSTPYDAPTDSRFRTIAFSGTTIDRNATSSSRNARASTNSDHVRHAVLHLLREVDVLGDRAGHRRLDARNAAERRGHEIVAQDVDRAAARRVVAAARRAAARATRPSPSVPALTVNGECAIPRATTSFSSRCSCAARRRAARVGPAGDDDRRLGRRRERGAYARERRELRLVLAESALSLGFETCIPSAGQRERYAAAPPRARTTAPVGAGRGRSPPARTATESGRCAGAAGTDPPAVDLRPEQLEHAGRTVTDPTTAQATTAIVAARDAVEDLRADDVHAGHRDRDGRAETITCGPTCARLARAPRATAGRAAAPAATG